MTNTHTHAHLAPVEDAEDDASAEITIQGHTFVVPTPFTEGHKCSKAEAEALNQLLKENLRNNFASKLRKAKEDHGEAIPEDKLIMLKSSFQKYADDYTFQGRKVGVPRDPVTAEATKIAKDKVREALAKRGVTVKSLAEGRFDSLVAEVLAKYPAIRAEAQRRVSAQASVAIEALD